MSDLTFGRDTIGTDAGVARLEWLVTNGIGGYACGTLAGVQARSQHGLLVAALKPPVARMYMLAKLAEHIERDGAWIQLDANRWASGALVPRGHLELQSFHLEGTIPVWTWAIGDTRLEKRVWMEQGENTTYLQYRLVEGPGPLTLTLSAMVNHRDANEVRGYGEGGAAIEAVAGGLKITLDGSRAPLWLLAPGAELRPATVWYRNYGLSHEAERGRVAVEDHLHAAEIVTRVAPGETFTVVASTRHDAAGGPLALASALARRRAHDNALLDAWKKAQGALARNAPDWIRQLVLAADAFVVERPIARMVNGRSVIAGYPWFADRGRDAMVSLPGLTIATGRLEIARALLTTYAGFLDQGMLPNQFPDGGEAPRYDGVDAALWFFQAVRSYHDATGDDAFLSDMYPVLEDIGAWYEGGTRHAIRVDGQDGLLRAGEPGAPSTWMDARVDDWVVTPRQGKPVEVNALWYNALTSMVRFALRLKRPSEGYEAQAERVRRSFARFLNPATGCLYDVVDGPHGHDAAIRPNQIFALSLPDSPLSAGDRRAVLEVCGRELLTSFGLRSLSPRHREYRGVYAGDRHQRDAAYHQGTVWTWLLPHYVLAHARVHGDATRALRYLEPFASLIGAMGVGTLPEVTDGDVPHQPRGCIAQAWTVAETLRVWHQLAADKRKPNKRTVARKARRALVTSTSG